MNKQLEQEGLATFENEVKRNYRRNFTANVLVMVLFRLGMGFVSFNTVLPAFARHFTSSNFLIGLIPSLNTLGWFLPQILIANFIQKLERKKERKKDLIIFASLGERIPWFFLFLAVMFLSSSSSSSLLLVTFFIIYALFCFSLGIVSPTWQDMRAKVIPLRKRGRFFGWSNFLAGGVGIFGASLSIYLLRILAFPRNFALCFLFASLATAISYIPVTLIREPAYPVKSKESSFKKYFLSLPSLLKKDKNFSYFLIAGIFSSSGAMATSFFAVYAMNKLTLPDSQIGVFTLLLFIGQTISSVLWGYLGDKKGYKLVMEAEVLLTILAILLAIFSSSVYLFYGVFFIFGCAFSAYFISSRGIVLEFSTPEVRPTYIALSNTIRAPFISLSPLLGGFLVDRIGFSFVFVITVFILLAGILYLALFVKEPRHLSPSLHGKHVAKKGL